MDEKLIKFTLPWSDSGESAADAPSKARILVAEDDPVSRTLISSRLAKWGYEVVITHDGAEAMDVLRGPAAPALAILDWAMPGMDGLEICRRLRDAEKTAYVILLTAHGSKENMVEGLRAGADDYLIKPFHAEELKARVLVGWRVIKAQEMLTARVRALEVAAFDVGSSKLGIPL